MLMQTPSLLGKEKKKELFNNPQFKSIMLMLKIIKCLCLAHLVQRDDKSQLHQGLLYYPSYPCG
jgi:hypothetical protein